MYKDERSLSVHAFIKSVNSIHLNLSYQLNNNTVALSTKNHKIVKNRYEILKEKLKNVDELTEKYLKKCKEYNHL